MEKKVVKKINIQNKKASFEYEFIEKFVSGIVLLGTEIKSICQNGASISESYCYVNNGEIFVKNMHISHLKNAGDNQHDPIRERKLLLNKKEINKIIKSLKDTGVTLIPILLFTNDRGLAKIEIAVSKGKKLFDKRNSIKDAEIKRQTNREVSNL